VSRPWVAEAAWVGGLWMLAVALAGASSWCLWAWLGFGSMGALAAGGLVLGWRGVAALCWRHWIGGVLRLLALPLLLAAVLAACVMAGFAGKAARMAEFGPDAAGPRTLPIEAGAMGEVVAAGERLAAQIRWPRAAGEDGLVLESVQFAFGPGRRELEFSFVRGGGGYFRGTLRFRQKPDGGWAYEGHSASGDTAGFSERSALFDELRAGLTPPADLLWPVSPEVERRWTAAADELAAVLSAAAPLGTEGAPWRADSVKMTRQLRTENRDAVAIWLGARRGSQRVAYAVTTWAFDGRRARLVDVSAGVDSGNSSRSTMEDGAEIRSLLEPWLAGQKGLLEESALYASRSDRSWESCEAVLSDGTVLTYHQQQAHLFLAEYHMRLGIRPLGGEEREFFLPMNTGGRTAILVKTGTAPDGTPAARVDAGRHFDLGFTLRNPRMIPAGSVRDETIAGAFTSVSTPLRWAASGDAEGDRLIEQVRGYPRGLPR
jgi:hypothetical protein